jgi:hypothetical protein
MATWASTMCRLRVNTSRARGMVADGTSLHLAGSCRCHILKPAVGQKQVACCERRDLEWLA